MTTKTLPELPPEGAKVNFLPWRPYSKKTMMRDVAIGLVFATSGVVLSHQEPSSLGLITAAVGAFYAFKMWRTSVKARKHQDMLLDVTRSLANKLSSNESNIREHLVMSEYFLSREDIRAWMADIIKGCKYNVILNKKGSPEHYFSWKLPETDHVILTATILSVIDAAFVHTCKTGFSALGFKGLDGSKSLVTNDSGQVREYRIRMIEDGSAEITDALTTYFAYHIEFFLNTWNLYPDLKLEPNTSNTFSESNSVPALTINKTGTWALSDGGVLEVVTNTSKGYDVTVDVPGVGRGMTLTHTTLESVNKTWAHLVEN